MKEETASMNNKRLLSKRYQTQTSGYLFTERTSRKKRHLELQFNHMTLPVQTIFKISDNDQLNSFNRAFNYQAIKSRLRFIRKPESLWLQSYSRFLSERLVKSDFVSETLLASWSCKASILFFRFLPLQRWFVNCLIEANWFHFEGCSAWWFFSFEHTTL